MQWGQLARTKDSIMFGQVSWMTAMAAELLSTNANLSHSLMSHLTKKVISETFFQASHLGWY